MQFLSTDAIQTRRRVRLWGIHRRYSSGLDLPLWLSLDWINHREFDHGFFLLRQLFFGLVTVQGVAGLRIALRSQFHITR